MLSPGGVTETTSAPAQDKGSRSTIEDAGSAGRRASRRLALGSRLRQGPRRMRHQGNEQRRNPQDEEAARLGEAAAILRRVREETEPQTGALASRLGAGLGRHVAGTDADPADPVELWGTRIGRGLGLLAFVALAILVVRQLAS
jgi:hypothetical protein